MKRILILGAFVLCGAVNANAQANVSSAKYLADNCAFIDKPAQDLTADEALLTGLCTGVFFGYFDIYVNQTVMCTADKGNYPCNVVVSSDGVTVRQTIRVLVKYMKEHPECENKPAREVYIEALVAAGLVKIIPAFDKSKAA